MNFQNDVRHFSCKEAVEMAVSSGMKKFLCLVAPLVLGLTGILLISTHRQIFHFIYKSNLVLAPGSASFPMWRQLPVPMLASIYLFQVKNPQVSKTALEELLI